MIEFPVASSCPQCGSVPIRLKRIALNDLIEKHGIAETIDALEQLVAEYAQLPENQPIDREWAKLGGLLDQAISQALRIQNLQHQCKEAV